MGVESLKLLDRKTERSPAGVLRAILDLADDADLQVGDQLPSIRELADRLEVKPTAVRDALLQAQAMGVLRVLPRAGAFLQKKPASGPAANGRPIVLPDDEHNLLHLLDARRLIEIELAGRAAERRRLEDLLPVRQALEAMLRLSEDSRAEFAGQDIRFHVEIARLAGNAVLFDVQRTLMEQLRIHLAEVPRTLPQRRRTDRSHAAVYAALVAGNAEQARQAMREHLSLAYDSLLRDIQEPPVVR